MDVLSTAYRFLKFFPDEFASMWNWSPILSLVNHSNNEIRWLATQCCSLQIGVSDSTKTNLLSKIEEIHEIQNK